MKNLKKHRHFLHILQKGNCKLIKAILQTCDDSLIKVLFEIVHNVLNGNAKISKKQKALLKRYKRPLRLIKTPKTSLKRKRKILIQTGGAIIPTLVTAALGALFGKIADYVTSKV